MNTIVDLVAIQNKEWVSTLELKDVAHLLDSMALMPEILRTVPNAAFVLPEEKMLYSETPALKGLEGENEFEKMCVSMLPQNFKVINTAKKSKSGDFLIEWTSPETGCVHTYLIDIKNYKSTVPSKEVDKFYRDIELKSSLSGAILISLHSKIVGRKSVFQYEERMVNVNRVPIAYVCSNEPNVISEIIKFMCNLSDIKQTCGIKLTSSEKVMHCIKDLESTIDMFSRSRGNLHEIKMILEKQFNKIFIDLLSVEHIFKTKIQTITQTLIEEASPVRKNVIVARTPVVPEPSSRKANIPKEPVEDILPKPPAPETKTDIITSLAKDCENYSPSDTTDSMLRHIWSAGDWDTGNINSSTNEWTVSRSRDKTSIVFKFAKKHTTFLIPNIKSSFMEIIATKKIGRITRKGYTAKLNANSYDILCLLCNITL